MGWQILKQPDGKYAVWSTITDAFNWIDCTKEALVEKYVESYREEITEKISKIVDDLDAGKPDNHMLAETWDSAVERIVCVHGVGHEYVQGLHKRGLISDSRMGVLRVLARISNAGILELTMDDMRQGTVFETATVRDIRFSFEPILRASYVHLLHEGQCRVFKPSGGFTTEQYEKRLAELRAQE